MHDNPLFWRVFFDINYTPKDWMMDDWTEKRLYRERMGEQPKLLDGHTLAYEFSAAYARVLMNGTTYAEAKAKFDHFRKRASFTMR